MVPLDKLNMKKEDVLVFEIELTGTCNLDCVLCAREFSPMQDKNKVTKDILKTLLIN